MSETRRSHGPPYHYHLLTVYTDCQAYHGHKCACRLCAALAPEGSEAKP